MSRVHKLKTYSFDLSKYTSKSKPRSTKPLQTFINQATKSLFNQGASGYEISQFLKLGNQVLKGYSKKPTKSTISKLHQLITNSKNANKKGNNIRLTPTPYTKYNKDLIGKFTAAEKKKLLKSGVLSKNQIKKLYKAPKRKQSKIKISGISGYNVVYEIIEGMGGIRKAVENYLEAVKRLFNDYLGINYDELTDEQIDEFD